MSWSTLYIWRMVRGQTERIGLLPWDEDERNFYGVPFGGGGGRVVYPKSVWHRSAVKA